METCKRTAVTGVTFRYAATIINNDDALAGGDTRKDFRIDILAYRNEADAENGKFTPVGEASISVFDVHFLRTSLESHEDMRYELSEYGPDTGALGYILFDQYGDFSKGYISRIRTLSRGLIDEYNIDEINRIAIIKRRVTFPQYRGNNITKLFYENVMETLNCDLLVTRPFPLQYEGLKPDKKPKKDEFGLTYTQACKKIQNHYRKAGMRTLKGPWMCMLAEKYILQ